MKVCNETRGYLPSCSPKSDLGKMTFAKAPSNAER